MYTQKIANIFDHIQDHSRLGLENKFLENKSRQIFLRSTGLLTNSCQQIWGCLNQPFMGVWKSRKAESGIGTGIGTGTGTGTGMGRETCIKAGTTFTLIPKECLGCLWHSHGKNPVRLYPKLQSQPIGLRKTFIDYLFFQADQSDCTKSVSIFNRFVSSEER